MAELTLSIHKIVCPTDFSDSAAAAFAESVRLARWFGARVTVLHVAPLDVPLGGPAYVPLPVSTSEELRRAKLLEIRRFVGATEHAGVLVETACREGIPGFEICKAVREIGADLVVMGTHGRSGFKRLVLGSVTEAVLRDAPALVLTVRRDVARRSGLFRRIVCATDISERSARTIAVAKALTDESARRLTILNVVEDGRESGSGDLERAALAALRELVPDETRDSCRIVEQVAFGEADREILRLAADEDADLIIMGAHRRGPLGALFGSTVQRVVRDSTCPVLLVPTGFAWAATALAMTQTAEPVGATAQRKETDHEHRQMEPVPRA
jgi:nucleotide-binding universal stress UspA family protein